MATKEAIREKPMRIQRKRTRGWRMPPNTVYVGRPTKWGNPFPGEQFVGTYSAADAVRNYRDWLRDTPQGRAIAQAARKELRGKDLACWCGFKPCHADVLLQIANANQRAKGE